MDPYEKLAVFYDLENADLVEDLAFYAALAGRQGDPILDVGCGTGRVALHLASRGHRVVGVEPSPAMLGPARRKALEGDFGQKKVTFYETDIAGLAIDERFSLAIFAFNGFMHLTSRPAQLDALKAIRRYLVGDGLLAVDVPNAMEAYARPDDASLVLERTFGDPETGDTIMQQSVASLDRASQLAHITWVYDRVAEDGRVTRVIAPVVLRYTFLAEMELLLTQGGLCLREVYGDYEGGSYEETSPRMLVVAAVDDC